MAGLFCSWILVSIVDLPGGVDQGPKWIRFHDRIGS